MTVRKGQEAYDWGRAWVGKQGGAPTPAGDWEGRCQQFVRMCFGHPGGIANAGLTWDLAEARHQVGSGMEIPAFVPVCWETSSVNDHIGFSIGGGMCLSTDVPRGRVGIVNIDALSRSWGMQLHGWVEDFAGDRCYDAPAVPKPPAAPKPLNDVQKARKRLVRGIDLLKHAEANGRGQGVIDMRRAVRAALREGPKK